MGIISPAGIGLSIPTQGGPVLAVGVNVVNYGADPTGTNDSTVAIQNAINALPLSGGTVFFPAGTYKIGTNGTGLTIGNGTNAALSTRNGITLQGGVYGGGFDNSNPTNVLLTWGGSTNDSGNMISVNGPIKGWGISNLTLNGANKAHVGINLTSAAEGLVQNVQIYTCTFCMFMGCVSGGALTGVLGTYHNVFINTTYSVQNNQGSNYGIFIDAATNAATNDTFMNTWLFSYFPFAAANANHQYGIYFRGADNNQFYGVHFAGLTAASTQTAIEYDYSTWGASNAWPGDNLCMFVNFGTSQAVVSQNGSPPAGTIGWNRITNINYSSAAPPNPDLANLLYEGAVGGAPSNSTGPNGTYVFRGDGSSSTTHLYFKSAGTWTGIA